MRSQVTTGSPAPVRSIEPVQVLGIDACRGKWLALVIENGRYTQAVLAADARDLVAQWPEAAAVGIDIPSDSPKRGEVAEHHRHRLADFALRRRGRERGATVVAEAGAGLVFTAAARADDHKLRL